MRSVKNICIAIVAYTLCILQCYFSMNAYAKELSAFCLNCGFYGEILITGLLSAFIFPIVWLLKVLKWNIPLKNGIISICFLLLVYMVNTNIFNSRVASWSSYSHTDVLISVFFLCYPYLLVSTSLFWVAVKKLKLYYPDTQ